MGRGGGGGGYRVRGGGGGGDGRGGGAGEGRPGGAAGRTMGAGRKVVVTMWRCSRCQYSNFRRTAVCRACGDRRAFGAQLIQELWVESALPPGWDVEPRPPLARRPGNGFGNGGGGRDGGIRGGGPVGFGGATPLVLRRGEGHNASTCPTTSGRERHQQQRQDLHSGEGVQRDGDGLTSTRNRWTNPPRGRVADGRVGAPGVLDGRRGQGGAGGGVEPRERADEEEGWLQGLDKNQRKRLRQRARRKAEAAARGEAGQEANEEGDATEEGEGGDQTDDEEKEEPVRPYQPPPLPRKLCVQQAEQLQRRFEKLRQDGARPQLLQKAEKRLEDAKKLVRDAGGPTERRLVFSILQEETREFKLREAIPRAEKKVRDMESNLREAQKELEAARRKQTALEALWRNSKARIAFLASEKAAETVSQEQTTAVHEALQRILATTSPALQAQARMVSEYFRAVAPIQARATEERFYDLSDGDTQDEAQAMEGITEQQRQGVKRQLEKDAKGGGGALPLPVRDTASLEDAKVELARLRHQKLAAISAAFDRKGEGSEVVPTMSPSELSDRFDHELQRAMEQVRRCEAAQAEAADPTPTPLVPASSPGVQGEGGGGEGTVGGEGGEASQGEEGGRKMAKTSTAGSLGEAGDEGGTGASVEQRVLGSRQPNTGEGGEAGPASTRWEQGTGQATGEVGVRGLGPHVELECPGCGRGPIAPQALTGSCECGAAVCMECGEGGIQINNCLLCFEDWTNGQGDIQAEATPVPGPRAFAGTLSSDLQDEVQARSTASRKAAPYAR